MEMFFGGINKQIIVKKFSSDPEIGGFSYGIPDLCLESRIWLLKLKK
jgi:hypothetical protein